MTDGWINSDTLNRILEELRLNEATFRYGLQEIIRAQRVLALLKASYEKPPSLRTLSSFIAPVVCASREDQELFHARFVELAEGRDQRVDSGIAERYPLEIGGLSAAVVKNNRLAIAAHIRRFALRLVIVICSMAVLLGLIFFFQKMGTTSFPPSSTEQSVPTQQTPSTITPWPHLFLAVSPLVLALLVVWWQYQRTVFLRRRFSFRRFDEKEVRFGRGHDTHLDPRLMARALPALRQASWTSTKAFDPVASVAAAVAAGGRGLPQFRDVLHASEFILLIRRQGPADHVARVARDLARYLQSAAVPVVAYEVLGISELLRPLPDLSFGIVPLEGGPDEAVYLADALQAVPCGVVLFFGDGRELLTGSDAPGDSAAALLALREARAILTPVPMVRWGGLEQSLEDLGYAVVSADSPGIAALGTWAFDGSRNDVTPITVKILERNRHAETLGYGRFPGLLVSAATRFLSRRAPAPEQIDKLLMQLKSYLGTAVFTWLGALAVYPRVAPDLTRELGRRLTLKSGEVLFSEQRYLVLAQLPWIMRGSLPDWIRTALIDQMESDFIVKVRRELRNLLIVPNTSGQVALGIVTRFGPTWNWVRNQLLRDPPPDTEMHEQVFLEFMSGTRSLSTAAPNSLIQTLMGLRRLLSLENLIIVACIILSVGIFVRPSPNLDQLVLRWADWSWWIALLAIPTWNVWRLMQPSDKMTPWGALLSSFVVAAAAFHGMIKPAWIVLVFLNILWCVRWFRTRPLTIAPILYLVLVPVAVLFAVTVAVDPAILHFAWTAQPPRVAPPPASPLPTSPTPASKSGASLTDLTPSVIHWIITLLGLAMAAWLALDAFNRPWVSVADQATLPKFMTSQSQYRLGAFVFILFACGFFLLLVQEHSDILALLLLLDGLGIVPKGLADAAQYKTTPYLLVISVIGGVYLYLLTQEGRWNVLLMMRDVIHRWVGIPQRLRRLVTLIQVSLRVPDEATSKVISRSPGLLRQDFHNDRRTVDRIWAETCYMEWWLNERVEAGKDSTFFEDDILNYDYLRQDFHQFAAGVRPMSGAVLAEFKITNQFTIEKLHKRFSRLVACYLLYWNGSSKHLSVEAERFGITYFYQPPPPSPVRYWIVYVIALVSSTYLGVYISAIGFDLLSGTIDLAQDPDLAWLWAMYTLSNFGLAIFVVLVIRSVLSILRVDSVQSHLITYSWTFLVAAIVGPFGLAIAAHFSPYENVQIMSLFQLYLVLLKWGIGPGLVCVYISYYLDRQTYGDLPNIVHSPATFAWRLLNCFIFAALTVLLLMPPILTVKAQPPIDVWSTEKLRFVSAGCTFFVVLGLALTAQFAIRERKSESAAPVSAKEMAS